MIPKILHSVWFGPGKKSDLFINCMRSWPTDWPVIETTESNVDFPCAHIDAVVQRGEFVKATELARLVAVHRHGGIYMDCDVEVLRPLDPLLTETCFFGYYKPGGVNGAVFGAEKGSKCVEKLIDLFPKNLPGMSYPPEYGPVFLTDALRQISVDVLAPMPTIFPQRYFYPYSYGEKDPGVYPADSYTVHRWAKSWG
jgi:mannosyltransferase OCH1-like enzyme